MMTKVLIKGGWVIDPASGVDGEADILVDAGRIDRVEKSISPADLPRSGIIDASGKVVVPGFVDLHVHLREPGREDEETIETGARAAVRGGFTAVAAMANTDPPADRVAVIHSVRESADKIGLARVFPVGAVSKKLEGRTLAELAELKQAGAVAFSDDGQGLMDAALMRRALEYTTMLEVPVVSHAEDRNLTAGGQMNEGFYATMLGLPPIPAVAEEIMVARDLSLAEMTGGRLHIAHVSTASSVALIRQAKSKGVKVTCEVTPHHLALTDSCLVNFDTNLKVNPPLRSAHDVKSLKEGLGDGTIDAIASDHAPHALEEKEREFALAPFGIIGLETAFSVAYSELVRDGVLTLSQLVTKLTVNPAGILGLSLGTLAVGASADVTVVDPEALLRVDRDEFESKSRNSPFNGWELSGAVTDVVCRGRIVVREGKLGSGRARKKSKKTQVKIEASAKKGV